MLIFQRRVNRLRSLGTSASKYCGWLNVPMSIKETPIKYSVGSSVKIKGCRSGYRLFGQSHYNCIEKNGEVTWSPPIETECKGKNFF